MRSPHHHATSLTTSTTPLLALIIATLLLLAVLPAPTTAAASRTGSHTVERTNELHLVFRRGEEHDGGGAEDDYYQPEQDHSGGGDPVVNAAPPPGQDEAMAGKGYAQTTYYKCQRSREGSESCGWHVPVVKATASKAFSTGAVVAGVMAAACFFALALG